MWRGLAATVIVGRMNPTDEIRYLDHLVNALTSGRLRLMEGDQDVTERELGHLTGEVAAIESMLQQAEAGRDEN